MVNIQLKVTLNPINANSILEYYLENDSEIELAFYKINGCKVLNLSNGMQIKGTHKLTINSKNLSSGTYNLILKSCGKSVSERVVVVK